VPELAVLYTRPCGVPSVGREPEKRRFAPLPQRALATASSAAPPTLIRNAHNRSKPDGELGERLNFASQISAEGAARRSDVKFRHSPNGLGTTQKK